jgi:hypothetical protein
LITRPAIVVALALVAPVVVAAANPSLAAALGLDVWNLPDLREQAKAAAEEDRELTAHHGDVLRRIEAKEQAISSLIAGRGTLADTVAQFSALNQDYPEYAAVIRDHYPGSTDQEKLAWNVIDFTQARLVKLPLWRRCAVLARLEAELHSLPGEIATD